ncbi:carbamoyl-phosphate synthase (glutamine-hydrolyzing) large subunit [Pyrococcus sp. ST04]|uniref:carbamoyl-phosphate synthase (glutamine-hydrolyzing) large subunit n=1 Tax=Pyrococcus sp. ST04 TaxID=1183377 RepID=UPI0002605E30|nr:carbamoyl-phosphate synthase (glutamine-hydrolyzing) large subunit [Pyrococcus sp. ST04]AFK23172.1 carbamoyl phosphate synthase large subunit [Pyrococcus sp. ST04]
MLEKLSKVLIIGSGAIKIGEAAEFDYSGSQALKALREEGIETILVNPNVATIQTSHEMADKVYLVPLKEEFVEEIIKKEKPDGILLGFGGQTALSLGVSLYKKGVLEKYNVKVLGTPVHGIERALDREKFRETMIKAGLPVPPSGAAKTPEEAIEIAENIGFPVIVRVSFNLGGRGSFIAHSREEFEEYILRAFAQSEIRKVLVEKYLDGWKEIEFEVVRDRNGNAVAVACLENVEPMGVHTGESTVVGPSQTLTNRDYQILRTAAIKVAEAIELIGEGNVQLALSPNSEEYYVIETNPRMSRSSALASKVTGYPLAYIAAKLAIGYTLDELRNTVTGVTTAAFEPSLDYVVVKVPRWDLQKFDGVSRSIGSEMKSIGEVMAIGRNLHEAFQKAIRMLDIGDELIGKYYLRDEPLENVLLRLKRREPYLLMHLAKALRLGATVDQLYEITKVDKFFLYVVEDLVNIAEQLRRNPSEELVEEAKKLGFSDAQIELLTGRKWKRKQPVIKSIDTLAGEFPAKTNYLYVTHDGIENDIPSPSKPRIIVLGAGVFRIGVSVEFDWAVVNFTNAARRRGIEVAIINYNPETVSTDWDMSDRLYFEEITLERVLDIYNFEKPMGVVAFAGGQLANSLARKLEKAGVKLLGTSGKSVDRAENRAKFSALLEKLGIPQPQWISAESIEEALRFAEDVGYPVIVRPSYVLSGTAMKVAWSEEELVNYLKMATEVSPDHPVVVSKFINAVEAEIDAVSDGKRVVGVTLEHIESAGVHSGDSTMVTPWRTIGEKNAKKMGEIVYALANELDIKGPFNVQFIVDRKPYVLELNLRTSRSMPFSSKSRGVNLMELSAQAVLDGKLSMGVEGEYYEIPPVAYAVKSPQFSWAQLQGAYPFLGPEMRSTGEVASLGTYYEDALLKSWLSAKPNEMPKKSALVYGWEKSSILGETVKILEKLGITVYTVEGSLSKGEPKSVQEIASMLKGGEIDIVMTTGYAIERDYIVRRLAADMNVPLVLDANLAFELAKALEWKVNSDFEVKELREYWTKLKEEKVEYALSIARG